MNELGTVNIYVLVCGSGQAHSITVAHVNSDSKGSLLALHVEGV